MAFFHKKGLFNASDINVVEECVEFIKETLSTTGVDRKQVLRTMLIAEDSIAGLLKHAAPGVNVTVSVKKVMGDTVTTVSVPGSEYDPYDEFLAESSIMKGTEDEKSQNVIRSVIINAYSESYKFNYKKGVNTVKIYDRAAGKSMLNGTLIALIAGLIFGFLMKAVFPAAFSDAVINYALDPFKNIFMNAIRIIIAPVVFFSIASCISQFKDLSQLGRITTRVIIMYLTTTVVAVLLAMVIFMIIKPGEWGFALSAAGQTPEIIMDTNVEISPLQTFFGIVPSNFIRPFLDSDTLQIIFLGILCGIAVGMVGEYSEFLKKLFEACNSLFLTITMIVSKIVPLTIFCSVAIMVRTLGGDSLIAVLSYAATSILTLFCMLAVYGLIILIFGHVNPVTFFKKNLEGMLTSFSLSSSSAAMPVNMRTCTDKLGISPKVCSFSIPLGATINMDGTCILLVMTGLFLARAYGVDISPETYLGLAVTAVLLSLGTPGVPGVGMVCTGVVLTYLGMKIECMGLIIAITPFIDMFATMSNTTGDVMTALVVARKEGLLDLDVYNS
ncbi:MAG: dicarboxylate/amino acid:cation symporter [Lachnospiraceae bacterium]|nr:dicarboxylate/amino acid:cation symporter [Lachnospiraceae bacterium]